MMMGAFDPMEDADYRKNHDSLSQRVKRAAMNFVGVDVVTRVASTKERAMLNIGWNHGQPFGNIGLAVGLREKAMFFFAWTCSFRQFAVFEKIIWQSYPDCSECEKEKKDEVDAQRRLMKKFMYERTGKELKFDDDEDEDDKQPVAASPTDGPKPPRDGALLEWQ